jgi:hypothetical protein
MLDQALEAAARQSAGYRDRRTKAFREWHKYHRDNPHVYDILVDILHKGKYEKDFHQWSVQGAIEIARWERRFKVDTSSEFKIANAFGAYYSRLIMMQEPDLYNFMRVTSAPADYELGWVAFKSVMRDA